MKKVSLTIFWSVLVCLFAYTYLVPVNTLYGSGDDDLKLVPPKEVVDTGGDAYARILYRDDLINPFRYLLEIKIPSEFPSIQSKGIQSEMNIHALVRLRGVYSAREKQMVGRFRPHIKIERERSRYNASMTQIWKLLSSAEYLILRNIEVDKDIPYSESHTEYPGFTADVYYVVGEVERNLANDLLADGYLIADTHAADMGSRLP